MSKNLPQNNIFTGFGTIFVLAVLALVFFLAGGIFAYTNQDEVKNFIAGISKSIVAATGSFEFNKELRVLSPARFLQTSFFGETNNYYVQPNGDAAFHNLRSSSLTTGHLTTDSLTVTRSETIAGLNAQFLNSLTSDQFLRSDTSTSFTSGTLTLVPGTTLNVSSATLALSNGQIPYSKLNLTNSIVNSDINSQAAISYSKLNLAGSIVGSDLSSNITISTTGTISAAQLTSTGEITASGNITTSGIFKKGSSSGLTISPCGASQYLGGAGFSGGIITAAGGCTSVPSSISWSSLTDPTANLSLSMNAFSTTFTWGGATGTNNLLTLTDTASNTGTGYLLNLTTATGSTIKPLHISSAGTEALTILANGNVGIGTTSPGQKLEVNGAVKIGAYTLPSTDGTSGQVLQTNGSGTVNWQTGSSQWTTSGSTIYYNTGSVGIGTTNPQRPLEVSVNGNSGDGTQLQALRLSNLSTVGYGPSIEFFSGLGSAVKGRMVAYGSGTQGGAFKLELVDQTSNTLTTRLQIDNAGNIGIGTTSPMNTLHVVGGIQSSGAASAPSSGNGVTLSSETSYDRLQSWNNRILKLNPGGNEVDIGPATFIVDTSGNLKMGTTDQGGGSGVIAIANAGVNPVAKPNQGFIYVASGALKYQGPSTLTQVAAADYAEAMPFTGDLNQAEVVSASSTPKTNADLYNNFLVERSSTSYDQKMIGIVSSTSPETNNTTRMIALVGRVPVKFSSENGTVVPGNPLTTSGTKPGYAMKATKAGRTIGIALQAASSDGKILVFVNPSWFDSQTKVDNQGTVPTQGETVDVSDGKLTLTQITADSGVFQTITSTVSAILNDVKAQTVDVAVKLTAKTAELTNAAIANLTAGKAQIKELDVSGSTILHSPNGSCFRVSVDDSGTLQASPTNCPAN